MRKSRTEVCLQLEDISDASTAAADHYRAVMYQTAWKDRVGIINNAIDVLREMIDELERMAK